MMASASLTSATNFLEGHHNSEFVTFPIQSEHIVSIDPRQIYSTRKSLRRKWLQLSRFQRSLFYLVAIFTCLSLVYVLPVGKITSNTPIITAEDEVSLNKLEKVLIDRPLQLNPDSLTEHKDEEEANINSENIVVGQQVQLKPLKFPGPTNKRQRAVVDAFLHAYKGYKYYAWGHDNLRPIRGRYSDWGDSFSLGLTLVDCLDTMYIMGLHQEFAEAQEWVKNSLDFEKAGDVNLFETTIRVMGGLLSAYHVSDEKVFLDKARELGERMLGAFDTASGVPYSDINLASGKGHPPKWSTDSTTSEVATLQLEFRDLSRCTGNSDFEEKAFKVSQQIHSLTKPEGLVPIFINAQTGEFRSQSTISLGARGDSYYEYLLKQWIQTGGTIDFLKEDYIKAIEGVQKLLVKRTKHDNLLFIGELMRPVQDFRPKMDHLVCYLPGTLALGVHYGMPQDHMKLAEDLLYTCYQTYAVQPTFLSPEITHFNFEEEGKPDMYVKPNDAHNLLRPETVESLWYLYNLTGNKTYQDWGWEIFQGFEKYTRVANGYTSIGNVRNVKELKPKDFMESFFLGETLKYFYLLFSEDQATLSLDHYVFNTEAHPLPIYNH